MPLTGDVEITVLDGGGSTVVVPSSAVQVVIGTCSAGVAATIVASRDPNILSGAVGFGPAVEAAAMCIAAGGTVLFMKAATITAGAASAVQSAGKLGTSVITVTGAPFDAYLVRFRVTVAGTIGTTGIRFQISVDAGRNYGPEIALGTANTYAITGTGLTLNFAAGTLLLNDFITFGCTEPLTNTASVQACLVALDASAYSSSGWGSIHITGPWTGANASTIQGFLDTMVVNKTFTRAIINTRDSALPAAYGGAGETDATWSAAVALDYSAVSAKRICAVAGHYNMPGMYTIAAAGLPRYRRPGAFALAARQVTIRPQNHAGRVGDGALTQIVIDPTSDPLDGFNYHDERTSPALDVARFTSFRRRKGIGGFFVVNPNLMSPAGSIFTILPYGNVMDIGCSLLQQSNNQLINTDVGLNDNGTIKELDAQAAESISRGVLRDQMFAKSMISNFLYSIDRTNNVRATSVVNFSATLFSRGYILQINGSVGYGNSTGG
jgi:Protein of unknown function (DUF2586)